MPGIDGKEKNTWFDSLIVTGDSQLIPAAFTAFSKNNFSNLLFNTSSNGLFTFDIDNGQFTLLQRGRLLISATLNIQTSVGNSEIQIIPMLWDGSWQQMNCRIAPLPVQGVNQIVLIGIVNQIIEKEYKIKFEICSPNNKGNFETSTLNGAIVPAAILDLILFRR